LLSTNIIGAPFHSLKIFQAHCLASFPALDRAVLTMNDTFRLYVACYQHKHMWKHVWKMIRPMLSVQIIKDVEKFTSTYTIDHESVVSVLLYGTSTPPPGSSMGKAINEMQQFPQSGCSVLGMQNGNANHQHSSQNSVCIPGSENAAGNLTGGNLTGGNLTGVDELSRKQMEALISAYKDRKLLAYSAAQAAIQKQAERHPYKYLDLEHAMSCTVPSDFNTNESTTESIAESIAEIKLEGNFETAAESLVEGAAEKDIADGAAEKDIADGATESTESIVNNTTIGEDAKAGPGYDIQGTYYGTSGTADELIIEEILEGTAEGETVEETTLKRSPNMSLACMSSCRIVSCMDSGSNVQFDDMSLDVVHCDKALEACSPIDEDLNAEDLNAKCLDSEDCKVEDCKVEDCNAGGSSENGSEDDAEHENDPEYDDSSEDENVDEGGNVDG
jgi:hypothetical protein